jgi:serine/threonine protein kinase
MSSQNPEPGLTRSVAQRDVPGSSPAEIAAHHLPHIDGYKITGVLGQGGMGIVYRAVQAKLNRAVALKVLPSMIGKASPSAVTRFRREATAAAGLHHTNIVPIYDFGESRDAYYYAMELIEGEPVNALIPRFAAAKISAAPPGKVAEIIKQSTSGVIDLASSDEAWSSSRSFEVPQTSTSGRGRAYYQQVARWMADAAEALFYAHSEGIIHRDIKPANLILSVDGRIMITDFGLAKSDNEESVTVTGSLLGTVRYLSPEQAMTRRIPVDHRTDIYSLGATMYELLCFEAAFPGSDEKQILSAIITRDPLPPRKVLRLVPQELETICLKALERDPDARYATGRAFAEDLRRYLNDLPIVARKPGAVRRLGKFAKRHRALVTGAVAIILLASAVAVSVGLQRARVKAELARVAAQVEGLVSDGRVAELSEDWSKAAATYRAALTLNRHEPVVLGNLARVLQEQYDRQPTADITLVDEALTYCEEAIRSNPDQPRLANVYGVLLSMRGRYDESREIFNGELRKAPNAPWIWLNIAAVDFLEGKYDAAREDLTRSVQRPEIEGRPYCHGWRELATLQFYLNEPGASETIETALECGYGKHPFFHLVRARIRLASAESATTKAALADAEMADGFAEGRDPYIKRYLAIALLRDNQLEKARTAALMGQKLGDLAVYSDLLAALTEARLGNLGLARAALKNATDSWPPDLEGPGATRRSRHMGMLWFEKSDELLALRDEAVRLLQE